MTDITRYANVSLKRDTYNKLKDLSAMNRTPVSKSGLITYLVDKEWNNTINHYTKPASKKSLLWNAWTRVVQLGSKSRSSSEGKSNDN